MDRCRELLAGDVVVVAVAVLSLLGNRGRTCRRGTSARGIEELGNAQCYAWRLVLLYAEAPPGAGRQQWNTTGDSRSRPKLGVFSPGPTACSCRPPAAVTVSVSVVRPTLCRPGRCQTGAPHKHSTLSYLAINTCPSELPCQSHCPGCHAHFRLMKLGSCGYTNRSSLPLIFAG